MMKCHTVKLNLVRSMDGSGSLVHALSNVSTV